MRGFLIPAAFDGVQYYGKDSIFHSTPAAGSLVTPGAPTDGTYLGTSGDDIISGGRGNDLVDGLKGNDLLFGGANNDVINGGSGADTVIASSGNDTYNGGNGGSGLTGYDTLDYSLMKGNLTLNFGQHTADIGSGNKINHDMVSSFEVVIGTTGGTDTIRGDHNANAFVSAGANNTFRGGQGFDAMIGGSGTDTYVITKKDISDGSFKTFAGFTAGQDNVDLSDFMKGHTDPNAEFRFLDNVDDYGVHSTMVQALVHKQWVNVVDLIGVKVDDVGADHHAFTVADLHAHSASLPLV